MCFLLMPMRGVLACPAHPSRWLWLWPLFSSYLCRPHGLLRRMKASGTTPAFLLSLVPRFVDMGVELPLAACEKARAELAGTKLGYVRLSTEETEFGAEFEFGTWTVNGDTSPVDGLGDLLTQLQPPRAAPGSVVWHRAWHGWGELVRGSQLESPASGERRAAAEMARSMRRFVSRLVSEAEGAAAEAEVIGAHHHPRSQNIVQYLVA